MALTLYGSRRPSAGSVETLAGRTPPPDRRPGWFAGPLPSVLGEGCSLPLAGAADLIELFLEVFAASLPPVSIAGGAVQVTSRAVQVAGGAVQIVDQLGVLPLKLLDALVPRILLTPGRLRTAAPADPRLPCSMYRHMRPDAAHHFTDFLDSTR